MDPALLDNLREHHVSILSSYIVNNHIMMYSLTQLTQTPKGNKKRFKLAGIRVS